ncbi:DUF6059 family protein [Streptomyces sp. NPDC094038]|uniref:DUF6059 family protein n=1 Tax=Streptomyces sp. NPDC094038 TaxID=3366055 RepID=UPI003828ADED
MRTFLRRCARSLWQSLVAYGAMQTGVCSMSVGGWLLGAPPPGGPERLVPDQPLSELELLLVREFTNGGRPGV